MTVAVASGKGGTGKTTIAVHLALAAGDNTTLIDCDVEEPNCHLFFQGILPSEEAVSVPVPEVDAERCTACGECGTFCRYHAIVSLKSVPIIFPELCHGCGGCILVCPEKALRESPQQIGVVRQGQSRGLRLVQGVLSPGVPLAPPVIRAARSEVRAGEFSVLDSPPGTACAAVSTLKNTDYAVLVTEPTPFGLHDLVLMVDTVRQLGLNFGVVINKAGTGDLRVDEYCKTEHIPILTRIPESRKIAEAYAEGRIITEAVPGFSEVFTDLLETIRSECRNEGRQGSD